MAKQDLADFFVAQSINSRIKTEIVTKYFSVWSSVLGRTYGGNLAYIDLFCGPGEFEDGNESTPILILQKILESNEQSARLVTIFNDDNPTFIQSLQEKIAALPKIAALRHQPQVTNKKVDVAFSEYFGSGDLIPSFIFLDPCGYKALSTGLIKTLTQSFGCDAIVFFNTARLSNSVTNPQETKNLDNILSPEIAADLREFFKTASPQEKEDALLRGFIKTMHDQGVTYAVPFCFKYVDKNRTSHHLIFLSKNHVAYRIMKEIMAKVSSEQSSDGVSCFCYSDQAKNAVQTSMNFDTDKKTITQLEQNLLTQVAGQKLTTKQIFEEYDKRFPNAMDNPYTPSNYKVALRQLREKGSIESKHPRGTAIRSGTCADDLIHAFPKRG